TEALTAFVFIKAPLSFPSRHTNNASVFTTQIGPGTADLLEDPLKRDLKREQNRTREISRPEVSRRYYLPKHYQGDRHRRTTTSTPHAPDRLGRFYKRKQTVDRFRHFNNITAGRRTTARIHFGKHPARPLDRKQNVGQAITARGCQSGLNVM
ncbi:hypothetical protein BaRGS_00040499, partial [Batillaria attramentaria]